MSDKNKGPSVKILVTTHKEYRMPRDKMYLPIHVGAAIRHNAKGMEPQLGYLKDNEGENISSRNAHFCELTGLYWGWKHVRADYIGLVHYRRYFRGDGKKKSAVRGDIFDQVLRRDELLPMLQEHKIIVPRKRYYFIETLWSHYAHTHYIEHLEVARQIIAEMTPDYLDAFDEVMHRSSAHMFNMMIMQRDLLDEYCSWLFPILFALENRIDASTYTFFQGRYCGRVGELIFNVWLCQQIRTGVLQKKDIKVLPYIYMERMNWFAKGKRFLMAKFLHRRYD